MTSKPVTVVVVNSLSFTGTTWLNAVLGAHPEAFAIGPPDRVYAMRSEPKHDDACLVHGADCAFWPSFFDDYSPEENFFVQLASRSGCNTLITNNPVAGGAGKELVHRDIWVREIQLVRDGRAIAASYRRHMDGKASFVEAVVDFLAPAFREFHWDRTSTERLCLRYEDILADPMSALDQIGRYVGLTYTEQSLFFWKGEQHLTSGNQGTIALIRHGQGLPAGNFRSATFYAEQFERMSELGPAAFADERWRGELTQRDRFLFDLMLGEINEGFGYPRDAFTLREMSEFTRELVDLKSRGELPGPLARLLEERLRDMRRLPIESEKPFGDAVRELSQAFPFSVREQLSLSRLRRDGLHLNPGQLSRLGRLAGVMIGMASLTVLLWVLFAT